jgi:hypothetical protein
MLKKIEEQIKKGDEKRTEDMNNDKRKLTISEELKIKRKQNQNQYIHIKVQVPEVPAQEVIAVEAKEDNL